MAVNRERRARSKGQRGGKSVEAWERVNVKAWTGEKAEKTGSRLATPASGMTSGRGNVDAWRIWNTRFIWSDRRIYPVKPDLRSTNGMNRSKDEKMKRGSAPVQHVRADADPPSYVRADADPPCQKALQRAPVQPVRADADPPCQTALQRAPVQHVRADAAPPFHTALQRAPVQRTPVLRAPVQQTPVLRPTVNPLICSTPRRSHA